MGKKIYISLPVTSRKEPTIQERLREARKRCRFIVSKIRRLQTFAAWEIVTPFDVAPAGTRKTEAEIMGGCVQAVIECDAILIDCDITESKGCRVEETVARLYGKQIYIVSFNTFKVIDLCNHFKPIE